MIALAALIGLAVGAAAVWLYRGEQVRGERDKTARARLRIFDAEYDRDAMFIRALAAEDALRDALPTDKWAELTGAPTVAVDAEFDALADELWVRR